MSSDERIAQAHKEFWFDIPRSTPILEEMELLISLPKSRRPYCLLLIADSGMGKSMVLREMVRRHSAPRDDKTGTKEHPVVYSEMPCPVDVNLMLRQVLADAGCPTSPKNIHELKAYFVRQMTRMQTAMILVDEAQRLTMEHRFIARQVCECLKWMSTVLQVPLVAAATAQAIEYFESDPQLARRFRRRELLNWKLDSEFQQLVCSILTSMPLKDGFDAQIYLDPVPLSALHTISEGTTDGLFQYIRRLTSKALMHGQEYLSAADVIDGIPK